MRDILMAKIRTMLTLPIFSLSVLLTACGGSDTNTAPAAPTATTAPAAILPTAARANMSMPSSAIRPAVTSVLRPDSAIANVAEITDKTGINVLVVYPPSVTAAVPDVGGLITLAVAETNQAYVNSGINIQLNLANSAEINYSEEGQGFATLLGDLPFLSEVASLRANAGADIVVMLTTNNQYCGIAYLLPPSANAMAVVNYRCATGYYSFAHEIGHLQGAMHNVEDNGGTSVFSYGNGYRNIATSPAWRTIMSYSCPTTNCPRLQYFSNPNINYNGLAMGTPSTSDNARVLNETAARIADFRNQL